jgi:protein involved in polysaccharide export with SLBB domain
MTWKNWICALGLFVLTATWLGCGTPPVSTFTCTDDEIRVGDTLTISLLDIPDTLQDKQFIVRSDGTVNLQYIGSMKASGKKFGDFEKEIRTAYIDKKIFSSVTVVVKPGDRFYSVGGEVKAPARQVYVGTTTALRAIVTCGDFTEFANRKKVEILRHDGRRETMDCNLARKDPKYDRPICPGDAIFVPRSL